MKPAEFAVALRTMLRLNVKPSQILLLLTCRENPGLSYIDLCKAADASLDGYTRYGRFVRMQIDQGLIEDRRIATNSRTPGKLYLTDAGAKIVADIMMDL